MRKWIQCALVLTGAFLFTTPARAQNFIAITGTVTDSNGIPYGNGTMSAVLTPGSPGGWTLGGNPYSGQIGPVTLDSTGKFTANFGNNSVILPAGTSWRITVNSNQGGILPPLGTGAQTFSVTMTLNSSQDISATLNAAAPKLTNITVGSGTVTSVSGTSPIVATPNPIVGVGTISCPTCTTGSGASPRVAFWSSPSALSSAATFTWADGTNSKGLFTGPATSTFSANLTPYFFGAIPGEQNNRHILVGDADTTGLGVGNLFQTDKDVSGWGHYTASDFTNAISGAVISSQSDLYYNVPMGSTNANVQTSYEAGITSYGAGTSNMGVFFASVTNTGTGTVTNAQGFRAAGPTNSGGGAITNLYGYDAVDQLNIGTTITAAYNAEAQTAGAHAFGFHSAATNKDSFGSIFSGTDNVTAGSVTVSNGSANAHTIWGSAATTTNTILGFATAPTTGHVVTCTTSGTTCTLTDGGAAASGTVTSIATTSPITGGTITTTGTIACATCTTNAAALTNNVLVKGAGGQATQTSSVTDNGTTVSTTEGISAATYSTATNCTSSASPAVCGSAAAGTVVVAAAATTVVVNTTAVTANSEIFIQYDSSLGTKLSVTCNTTAAVPAVTARTAATSFTITIPAAPAVNPACYSYRIEN